MRLTRFTDYGLRTLIFLVAEGKGKRARVQDIVECFDLSKDHLVKIVQRLAALGYVETIRGKNGGIRLLREPAEINLAQAIVELESTLEPIDCEALSCRLSSDCRLRNILSEAKRAFVEVLRQYTVADLVVDRGALRGQLGLS